jgi:hypothetical protein
MQDRTLADYIKRTNERLEKEKQEPFKSNPNNYEVYPEKQNIDSDEKINPYSPV